MDLQGLLGRIADVALRDKIRRQVEIQNETIANLESLCNSQREKIEKLEAEARDSKARPIPPPSAPSASTPQRLFQSDGVLWGKTLVGGQQVWRPHCPQCAAPLNRLDFLVECKNCGFEDMMNRREPSNPQ